MPEFKLGCHTTHFFYLFLSLLHLNIQSVYFFERPTQDSESFIDIEEKKYKTTTLEGHSQENKKTKK